MEKKQVKLSESELKKYITESINEALNELGDTERGQYVLGQVARRAANRSMDALNKSHDYSGTNPEVAKGFADRSKKYSDVQDKAASYFDSKKYEDPGNAPFMKGFTNDGKGIYSENKNTVKLTEEDLKNIIRESVTRYINENMNEVLDDPATAIHASHKANKDKKNHPGRSKDSKDPEIRKKRDRQTDAFGSRAADLINKTFNDPRFTVHGERGARRMEYNGPEGKAFIPYDTEDLSSLKLYRDDYVEGDEPSTLSNLSPQEFSDIQDRFNQFRGYHDRASELDAMGLEEAVKKAVKRVLNETELSYDIDNFSGRWNRGTRYNIEVDGEVYYSDVPEETVNRLCMDLEQQGYENVIAVEI